MFENIKIKNFLKKAEYFFSQSDYDNALIFCNKVLKLDSTNIPALYIKSEIMYLQSQYALSLETLDEILNIWDGYGKALLLKGRINLELNNFKEGFKFYEEFLENNSDYNLFFDEISYFSFFNDDSKKKLALDLSKLYLDKHDSYQINVWKSQLLFRLNLLDEALSNLNDLIESKGDDEYLYGIKTQVLIKMGKYEDALTLSDYSFKLYNNYGFLYDKAEALFALGDYESSKKICNEVLDCQNNIYDNSAKFLMAKIYFAEKDYDKSLMEIDNAIYLLKDLIGDDYQLEEYSDSLNQYYFFKSEILLRLDKLDESNKIIDCLMERDESIKNYCLKARILYQEENYKETLSFIDKALKMDGECDKAIELKKKIENKI